MEKKIINIDSQLLSSLQTCERKTELKFINHLVPIEKSVALEKGELIHLPLEVYYGLLSKEGNIFSAALIEIIDFKLSNMIELQELNDIRTAHRRERIIDLAIQYARMKATRMNLDTTSCEEVIFQFSSYCEFYKNEGITPLAAEGVGSKILFDSEFLQIIYTFKIDLVAEDQHGIFPVDHKSSSRRQDPSSMSNQFMGYCWAINSDRICVNTIGFQKTLSPKERFQRHFLPISEERVKEWKTNAIYHIMNWERCHSMEHYPMRYSSCKGQFPCEFISICENNPDYRERIMEREFKIVDAWDPGLALERKENAN